jgi:tetraacyldisaccharide 4'-kinase
VAVLDSGFQHRRLRRDLEILCVDSVSAGLRPVRRLPAGPFRDRWTELRRADAIIIVRRSDAAPAPVRLLSEVRRQAPWATIGRCVLRPGELVPLNAAALEATPDEVVAVAGVMWPGPFFAQLRARGVRLLSAVAFRDHEPYRDRTLRRLERLASGHGIVCTPKDGVKLRSRLAEDIPLWALEERLEWEAGKGRIRACALRAARIGAPRDKGRAHAKAPEAA